MSHQKKPHCKVCQDAGKPEKEYTNHWVKDRNGNTTCPTLLNTECRYCLKKGHTVKFCSALANKNKPAPKQPMKSIKSEPPKIKMPSNCFAALDASDDEEEPEPQPVVEYVRTGWAAIAAKQPVQPKVEVVNDDLDKVVLKPRAQREVSYKAAPWSKDPPVITRRWADLSDISDSDDEFADVEIVYQEDDTW